MTPLQFCQLHDACRDGKSWAVGTRCQTMSELWARDDMRHYWRIWIATRPGVLPDPVARRFACWCVRQVWHLLTDERSRRAVEVAEAHADGRASDAELAAAWDAAWDAAWADDWDAAWDAARAAARAAAWDAARAAARAAAWDAAWDAQCQYLLSTPDVRAAIATLDKATP